MVPVRPRLGQLLVDAGLISPPQLTAALDRQRTDPRRLGTLLVEAESLNEVQLTQVLSQQLNAPWVSLYHIDFSRQLLNLVPRDVAERFCLVPIYVRNVRGQGNTLYVAMDDPTNEEALRSCALSSRLPARAMIAPPSDIRDAIRVYYGASPVRETPSQPAIAAAAPLDPDPDPDSAPAITVRPTGANDPPAPPPVPRAVAAPPAVPPAPAAPAAPPVPAAPAAPAAPPVPAAPAAPPVPIAPAAPAATALARPVTSPPPPVGSSVRPPSGSSAQPPTAPSVRPAATSIRPEPPSRPGASTPPGGPANAASRHPPSEGVSVGTLPPPAVEVSAPLSLVELSEHDEVLGDDDEVLDPSPGVPPMRPREESLAGFEITFADLTPLPVEVSDASAAMAAASLDPSFVVAAPTALDASGWTPALAVAGAAAGRSATGRPAAATPGASGPPGPDLDADQPFLGLQVPGPADAGPRPGPRMVSLTLLDGTTISLPARGKGVKRPRGMPETMSATPLVGGAGPSVTGGVVDGAVALAALEAATPASAPPPPPPPSSVPPSGADGLEETLTARDLVAALRAVAHGADASEILGDNTSWEALFAALLSLLLRKRLIADWEFVEEFKKI